MTTLLITGSRVLADTPAARWWATQAILRALAALPLGSVVVTGDASGPDTWARELALPVRVSTGGLALLVFGRDGIAHTGDDSWWWTPAARPLTPTTRDEWRARLLARDRAMVEWVARQDGERRCLALVAPWSRTHGTDYTARHAGDAGIVVERLVCPLEYGPEVTT